MRRFLLIALALLAVVMVRCSLGECDSGASQEKQKAPKGTFDLPNGRSLYMECRGSDSPTVIFEVGQGEPRTDALYLQGTLARHYMTCTYDRANTGKSSKAPTLRTAGEIVSDLHELLETADVPGPYYVLEGTSAGGSFVQLYGRRYPDEVVGVVAMKAVPPADAWMDRALPRFDKEERQAERAFYRGENPEQIDWLTSNEEFKKAPPPPPVPFEMIISTEVQCEGESEEDPGPSSRAPSSSPCPENAEKKASEAESEWLRWPYPRLGSRGVNPTEYLYV